MVDANRAQRERDGEGPAFGARRATGTDIAARGTERAGRGGTAGPAGDGAKARLSAAAIAAAKAATGSGRQASRFARRRPAGRRGRFIPLLASAAALCFAAGCATLPPPALDRPDLAAPDLDRIPAPVQTPPPVPRPEPGEPVETWSVSVEGVPVRELLFALARDAGIDMDIDSGIEERVTMNAVDEPLPRLIERISRQAGVLVEIENGALVARRDGPVLRTYPIDYVPLARETETVNEVGIGIGGGIDAPGGEENGSTANVKGRTEHRFWDALVESVRGVLGEAPDGVASVFAHRETSLIAVRASAGGQREVALLLDRVLASARRQVLIEATIVEVALDDRFRAGVDWSRVLGGNLVVHPFRQPFSGLSAPDLAVTVRLLGEFGDVRVLSTPLVMVLNNQTAIVKVAENRAFFTSEVRTETSDKLVERSVRTKLHTIPIGLILLVTPSVSVDDEIILKIRPTVTRESGFVIDPNPALTGDVESRIPQIAVREIESVLRLRSGEVAVLGGLMQEDAREDTIGVPLLSRLPGIGAAFRYRDRTKDKTELIVFLRPTVVREPTLARDLGKYRRWWPAGGGPFVPDRGAGRLDGAAADAADAAAAPAAAPVPASAPPGEEGEGRLRIDRALVGNPVDRVLHRAWTALRRGDHRTARAAYLEALDARPEEALAGLAAAALREARAGEARAWYLRLAALDPEHEIAGAMSFVLDRGGDPPARERELARRISLAPETAWLQVALGNTLAEQGRWEAAGEAYRAARRAAPSSPDPAYNLAVSAERRGRPRLALSHYRDALDLMALAPPAFDVGAVRDRVAALEERAEARP